MMMKNAHPLGRVLAVYFATLLAVVATLLFSTQVKAAECESLQVEVLPLEVAEDHTKSFNELSRMSGGVPTFGAVFATRGWTIEGCSVKVGYVNVTLRIAAELKRDSCAFEHVMTHEQEHIAIYRRHLATLAARVQARAGEADMEKVLDEETKSARVDHAAHDSPDEYQTNVTACRGRILRLAGLR